LNNLLGKSINKKYCGSTKQYCFSNLLLLQKLKSLV
jgi:hypothetical protein